MISNDNSSPSTLNSCTIKSRSSIYSGQDLKVLKSSFSQLKKNEIIQEKKTWFDWFVDKTVDILIPPDSDSNGVIFFGSHEKFDDDTKLEAHNHNECLDPFNGFDWDSISDEKIDDYIANEGVVVNEFLKLDPPSKSLNDKIKSFITDIGVDSENIPIRVLTDTVADMIDLKGKINACAIGSLGLKKCAILLTGAMAREMEEDFNETHQFAIAHEVGHLVNEHSFFKYVSKHSFSLDMTALKISLAVSTIGVLLIRPLDSCLMNIFFGGSIGLMTFPLFHFYLTIKNSIEYENCADRFAASRSADIAKGAVRAFEEARDRLMEEYNDIQQASDKIIHEPNASFTKKITVRFFKYVLFPMFVNKESMFYVRREHPFLSTRIENMKSYL